MSVVGLRREVVALVGGENAASGGAGEMGAEHERIRRGRRCKQSAPCFAGRVGIGVPARRPLRMTALDRVVQHVTGDHTALADPHAHMPVLCPACS